MSSGSGTACRRFFFHNAYLELLWVSDEGEARGESVEPLRLWERWRHQRTGFSPFGLALRPHDGHTRRALPFDTWAYRPAFSRPRQIDVAKNSARRTSRGVPHVGRDEPRVPSGTEATARARARVEGDHAVEIFLPGQNYPRVGPRAGRGGRVHPRMRRIWRR